MATTPDAVVIGAGHNGLTCACYLARAGLKVLVLEQGATVGGMTNTEEVTLPGFHSDTHAFGYQLANLSPAPRELELHRHGFELIHPEIGWTHSFSGGPPISVFRDVERSCQSIGAVSIADARTWRELHRRFCDASEAIAASLHLSLIHI